MITLEEVQQALQDPNIVGFKKYVALITQTSTNDPVATVLENTFGAVPTWTRQLNGLYKMTLTGAFTNNKTVCIISSTQSDSDSQWIMLRLFRSDDNTIYLTGYDVQSAESLMDDDLYSIPVIVLVYN